MIDTTKMKYADFERLCQEIEMKAKILKKIILAGINFSYLYPTEKG